MASSKDKLLHVLSAIWLLFSLPLFEIYSDAMLGNKASLIMLIFIFGLFSTPAWIIYAWRYLSGKKRMPNKMFVPILGLFFLWALLAFHASPKSSDPARTALGAATAFIVLRYFVDTYPARPMLLRWTKVISSKAVFLIVPLALIGILLLGMLEFQSKDIMGLKPVTDPAVIVVLEAQQTATRDPDVRGSFDDLIPHRERSQVSTKAAPPPEPTVQSANKKLAFVPSVTQTASIVCLISTLLSYFLFDMYKNIVVRTALFTGVFLIGWVTALYCGINAGEALGNNAIKLKYFGQGFWWALVSTSIGAYYGGKHKLSNPRS